MKYSEGNDYFPFSSQSFSFSSLALKIMPVISLHVLQTAGVFCNRKPLGHHKLYKVSTIARKASQGLSGKESTSQVGDAGLIPGWGRCSREENGNPLQ